MKQTILLGLIICIGFYTANTQNLQESYQLEIGSAEWEVLPIDEDWLDNDDNATRGMSLNPATGNILVASNTEEPAVYVLDSSTGNVEGTLDTEEVIETGFLALNQVGATEDGTIFAANSVVDSSEEDFIIYMWEDEASEMEILFQGDVNAARYGDALGIDETGDGIWLYFAGTGNEDILKLEYDADDHSLSEPDFLNAPAGIARGGISPIAGEDSLWVNGSGTEPTKISTETGETGSSIPGEVVSTGSMNIDFADFDTLQVIATAPRGTGDADQVIDLVDITDLQNPQLISSSSQLSVYQNPNATGAVEFDHNRNTLVMLSTNNAIASFPLEQTTTSSPVDAEVASDFELRQNYPNPFNPVTQIEFTLRESAAVTLSVFTAQGRYVKTLLDEEQMQAGTHISEFDASGLSSGIYLYRLQAGDHVMQRQMSFIK